MQNEFKLKARYFRRLPNPFQTDKNEGKNSEIYEVLIDIKDLPENMNFKTNPRFQNMKTKVVKKIKESLEIDDKSFYLKNRGIVISAKNVKFDNINNELTIELEDENVHGNVDGGHTYHAILDVRDKISHTHFVKFEIMTGIEDIFEDVAAARNTSVQVQDKAIAELKKQFDFIKTIIKEEPFAEKIAYKDNDDKDIEIIYIISVLFMFNIDRFNNDGTVPVHACSSTQNCMKDFLDTCIRYQDNIDENPYYKMKDIIVDLFRLHDKVQCEIGDYYQIYHGKASKYGRVKGVQSIETGKSTFYENEMLYATPKGFIFPILGSLRALVEEYNGVYRWKENPYKVLEKLGASLVGETIDRYKSLGNNPASVGKDSGHWKQLYRNVLMEYLLNKK
ncbi:AIPR family protein [Clostridium sp. ZS2]|uniref:AIPR family protein n=1 Tax=Clostridium sp. ZS2 TaxID=2949988 RepID=UPI00207A1E14|nr:AIPR family protein [Clostridium sp. ZS2]